MPLYEYHCRECDAQAELLVRGSEQPVCPQCGGRQLTKLLSVVAAPARDGQSGSDLQPPAGPCGSACGCFPSG
jgi:putative FmdB family regulatory protein